MYIQRGSGVTVGALCTVDRRKQRHWLVATASYLLRRGFAVWPGRLKHPRGMTMRALPFAGREPPTACNPAKWAAYPSLSTVALDCSFLPTYGKKKKL